MIDIKSLQLTRDQIWVEFWKTFYSKLTTKQKGSWTARKPEIEALFKQSWDSGAGTVIDLLNEAVKNRPRVALSQNFIMPPQGNIGNRPK